jgi:hypothetical protein
MFLPGNEPKLSVILMVSIYLGVVNATCNMTDCILFPEIPSDSKLTEPGHGRLGLQWANRTNSVPARFKAMSVFIIVRLQTLCAPTVLTEGFLIQ